MDIGKVREVHNVPGPVRVVIPKTAPKERPIPVEIPKKVEVTKEVKK
jgi:hypothetical protein